MNNNFQLDKWLKYLLNLKIRLKNNDENFNPSLISIINKPNYIIRKALYKSKKKYIAKITGDVLDIGCGNKPYEKLFVNNTKYVGLDTKSSGHKHKKENIDVYYDGKIFPFEDNSFDNAVCFQVLEHVEDIELFFHEVTRVIKKDGFILFDMPFVWEEHELPYDFRRYTSIGIQKVLKQNNLRLVKYERYCDGLEMIPQFINLYFRKLYNYKELKLFTNIVGVMPMNILGEIFSKINLKFTTIYGGHIFLAQNIKK